MEEESEIQGNTRPEDRIKPWQFQPGVSGNPGGKPKGTVSLKTYARRMIQEMTDEEKMEFMKGIDKKTVWEMSEGKAKQDVGLSGNLTISQVLDNLQNGQETPE